MTTSLPLSEVSLLGYGLENSVTFKIFNEPQNFRQWFDADHTGEEFVPGKNVDLPATCNFFGARNKQTGEAFALLPLGPFAKSQLAVHAHAATLRLIYPDFTEKNAASTYRVAYYFGKATSEDIQQLYTRLKNENK
ncbi:MAG: hypothetical protein ACLQVL_15270 [Terriglobia bacterium]